MTPVQKGQVFAAMGVANLSLLIVIGNKVGRIGNKLNIIDNNDGAIGNKALLIGNKVHAIGNNHITIQQILPSILRNSCLTANLSPAYPGTTGPDPVYNQTCPQSTCPQSTRVQINLSPDW